MSAAGYSPLHRPMGPGNVNFQMHINRIYDAIEARQVILGPGWQASPKGVIPPPIKGDSIIIGTTYFRIEVPGDGTIKVLEPAFVRDSLIDNNATVPTDVGTYITTDPSDTHVTIDGVVSGGSVTSMSIETRSWGAGSALSGSGNPFTQTGFSCPIAAYIDAIDVEAEPELWLDVALPVGGGTDLWIYSNVPGALGIGIVAHPTSAGGGLYPEVIPG